MSEAPAPPTRDYSAVTEVAGEAVRRDAVDKMAARYAFAAERAAGKDVLEVACGSAQGLGLVARSARRVVGGDYTFDLVRNAARHYRSRIPFVCLDAQRLPFRDGAFDLVLCYEAAYYFPEVERALREAHRVLRGGGEVIVVNVDPEWPGFNPSPHSLRYHTARELADLLRNAGFDPTVRGAFPEDEAGLASRAVALLRRLAIALHLMPKTMRGKRLLKRLFYGRLIALPPELQAGEVPRLEPIGQRRSTVIYAVGSRQT